MTLKKRKFFVIEYKPDSSGIPHYIDKKFTPELPVFNIHDGLPNLTVFSNSYTLKSSVENLNGDYYPLDDLASEKMLSLCSQMGVQFFSIPVEVELSDKKKPAKKYNIFYLKKYISIIDQQASNFEIDDFDASVNDDNERVFYSKIEKFVVKEEVQDDLFFCTDIGKPVCSLNFQDLFINHGLTGVSFTPIDDSYTYDEWED